MEHIDIRTISACLGIIVSLHTLSLAIYFFLRRKYKKREYTIFASILFLFSLIIVPYVLGRLGYLKGTPYWKFVSFFDNLHLVVFPLIYIYTQLILKQRIQLKTTYFLKHFWLYIIVFFYTIGKHLHLPIPTKNFYLIASYLYITQGLYYIVISYRLVKNTTSKELIDKVEWSKILLFVFSAYLLARSIPVLPFKFFKVHACSYTTTTYVFIVFVAIYVLAIFLIDPKKVTSPEDKYRNSNLSNQEENTLFDKIQQYFINEKPFLDNEFSLSKLSENLDISSKKISQVINSKSDSNFNDFVNNYRIQESAHLLSTTTREELLISDIYYTVGFNSKATFNNLFKKTYHKTPSQYRKEHS